MKTIKIQNELDSTVELSSNSQGEYKVVYGFEDSGWTDYANACLLLGQAIMHSAICAGNLEDID